MDQVGTRNSSSTEVKPAVIGKNGSKWRCGNVLCDSFELFLTSYNLHSLNDNGLIHSFSFLHHCPVTFCCIRHVLSAEDSQPTTDSAAATAEGFLLLLQWESSNEKSIPQARNFAVTAYCFFKKSLFSHAQS